MKRAIAALAFLGLAMAFLSSCSTNQNEELIAQIEGLEARVADLEQIVSRLSLDVTDGNSVVLDTADKGYGRLDHNNGFFLISVDSVEPYLDGQRVTLNIGNPLNATFNGFTATITWGKAIPQEADVDAWLDWGGSLRDQTFQMLDTLSPGRWNKVSFVLPGTAPDEARYLRISITTDVVSLY
ncbi:MAG: hypothetical protein ACOX35_06370 [Bacillota bacterium]|jgi:hypothetical protein